MRHKRTSIIRMYVRLFTRTILCSNNDNKYESESNECMLGKTTHFLKKKNRG